jgi:hypothetical protein
MLAPHSSRRRRADRPDVAGLAEPDGIRPSTLTGPIGQLSLAVDAGDEGRDAAAEELDDVDGVADPLERHTV